MKTMEVNLPSTEETPHYTNFLEEVISKKKNIYDDEEDLPPPIPSKIHEDEVCVNDKCGEAVRTLEMEVDEFEIAILGELRSHEKNYDICSFDTNLEDIETLLFGNGSIHLEGQENGDKNDTIMNLNGEKLTPPPPTSYQFTYLDEHEEISRLEECSSVTSCKEIPNKIDEKGEDEVLMIEDEKGKEELKLKVGEDHTNVMPPKLDFSTNTSLKMKLRVEKKKPKRWRKKSKVQGKFDPKLDKKKLEEEVVRKWFEVHHAMNGVHEVLPKLGSSCSM
ncbi:uncharacterized protein LOC141596997 [Silene latifolia]|uniref:uncharacterized protein LOC141596997 n=1 Tax=Silene latifolia TaxID=37657 RepID=UPI003D770EC3